MSQFAPNFAQKWKNGPCSHPWHYHYIFNDSILECFIHLLGFGYMIFFAHPTLCFIIFCISHGFEKIIFSHTFNPNFFLPSSCICTKNQHLQMQSLGFAAMSHLNFSVVWFFLYVLKISGPLNRLFIHKKVIFRKIHV